jgi:uncharacterized DUF497 family protein
MIDTVYGGFEWDEHKRQDTLAKRRLDFADVRDFDMATAKHRRDLRYDYGEIRYVSTGFLHDRLCVLCWTLRNGRLRVISLRKANDREKQSYTATSR